MLKFSIIIPTLNSEQFLRQTLESIKRQDYPWVQTIVVDGGSKDRTRGIAKEFDALLTYRKAQGEPDAINSGMELATGDILAYIDGDDVYEPGCFWKVAEHFMGYPDEQWVYGKGRIVDEQGVEARSLITQAKSFWWPRYRYGVLQAVCFIVQPTVFWRRELWEKVGQFRAEERLVFDYDYWLRAGKISKPGYIPHYLASWRAHEGAISVQRYREEADDALRIARSHSNGRAITRIAQKVVHRGTVAAYKIMSRG